MTDKHGWRDISSAQLKDGDVFNWRWKDDERHQNSGSFGSYHCWSCIATARNGVLFDSFWHNDSKRLNLETVLVKYRGNINEMTEIPEYKMKYYRPEDIVDLRHSNSTRSPVYLKAGAQKNATAMLGHVANKIGEAERNIDFAQREVARMQEFRALIEKGKLDEVYF